MGMIGPKRRRDHSAAVWHAVQQVGKITNQDGVVVLEGTALVYRDRPLNET
jgi:hypothetical protein